MGNKKKHPPRKTVMAFSSDVNRMRAIGWFDLDSVARAFEQTVEEPHYTSRLLLLESGTWVEEREYFHQGREVCYRVSPKDAALWLIKHGYSAEADELLAGEVEATRL